MECPRCPERLPPAQLPNSPRVRSRPAEVAVQDGSGNSRKQPPGVSPLMTHSLR